MQTDYGASLLSALLALAITAGLSYLLVRFLPIGSFGSRAKPGASAFGSRADPRASTAARRWLDRFAGRARLMEIEDMLRIDAKSTLLIVRVENRRLLLASHSGAAPALISELDAAGTRSDARASTPYDAGEAP